jgi:mitochondrial carrier
MTIRCMSQFVGGETDYSSWNVFQNTIVIYKHDGLAGFFSGLVPRILFEASTIALTSFLSYIVKTYIFEDKEVELFVEMFSSVSEKREPT